ncbi:hypothetical protein [Pseudoduganella albidiflava]|uniref:Uncharacterized protein n=1 Tax=Pseudoduganella albidiflava TaxID=321983 RepID=A0ABX5RXG1_9BURK|nr:hypothetical protein [Pseudoduganella albidiflava]QBI02742.1 hypothetical protein EYF70_19220 [Pseudoduganella albidiflava]
MMNFTMIPSKLPHHFRWRLLLFVFPLFLAGCPVSAGEFSSNIEEIRKQIDLDIPSTSGKWEIFEIPEAGGVPGPTDFVILIAEFDNVAASWASRKKLPIGQAWVIMPNAGRPWLSQRWKAVLRREASNKIAVTESDNCHYYSAKVRKSGRVVEGFTCTHNCDVLVHLVLTKP